jgi:hypothetical protein
MFKAAKLVRALGSWHVRSQEVARRNALVACTALAERRHELLEVEEYLAARAARAAGATIEVSVLPA